MIIGHNTIHPAVNILTSTTHRISLSRFLFVLFLSVIVLSLFTMETPGFTVSLQKKEILHEQLKTKEATLPSLTNLSNNEIKQNQEIDIKPIQAELIKAEREKEQLTQTNAQLQSKIDFFL